MNADLKNYVPNPEEKAVGLLYVAQACSASEPDRADRFLLEAITLLKDMPESKILDVLRAALAKNRERRGGFRILVPQMPESRQARRKAARDAAKAARRQRTEERQERLRPARGILNS